MAETDGQSESIWKSLKSTTTSRTASRSTSVRSSRRPSPRGHPNPRNNPNPLDSNNGNNPRENPSYWMARADLIRSFDSQRKEFRVPIFITSDSIEGPKYAHAKHKNEFCLWLHVYVEIKKPKLIVSNKSGRPAIDFEPLPVGETFVSYLEGKNPIQSRALRTRRSSKSCRYRPGFPLSADRKDHRTHRSSNSDQTLPVF